VNVFLGLIQPQSALATYDKSETAEMQMVFDGGAFGDPVKM